MKWVSSRKWLTTLLVGAGLAAVPAAMFVGIWAVFKSRQLYAKYSMLNTPADPLSMVLTGELRQDAQPIVTSRSQPEHYRFFWKSRGIDPAPSNAVLYAGSMFSAGREFLVIVEIQAVNRESVEVRARVEDGLVWGSGAVRGRQVTETIPLPIQENGQILVRSGVRSANGDSIVAPMRWGDHFLSVRGRLVCESETGLPVLSVSISDESTSARPLRQ